MFEKLKCVLPKEKPFLTALLGSTPPVLSDAFPLHDQQELSYLGRMLKRSFLPLKGIDVDLMRNYFGE